MTGVVGRVVFAEVSPRQAAVGPSRQCRRPVRLRGAAVLSGIDRADTDPDITGCGADAVAGIMMGTGNPPVARRIETILDVRRDEFAMRAHHAGIDDIDGHTAARITVVVLIVERGRRLIDSIEMPLPVVTGR